MSLRNTPSASSEPRSTGSLRAGVARSDITTDAADAVINDRLYARALVLDDGTTRLAIVTLDVTAIGGRRISDGMLPDVGEQFLPRLRERVERELGIPGRHVLVNASHTHPPGRMLCDDDEQVRRTFDAVSRAAASLAEARVGSGLGREDRISMNRTLRLRNGRHWTIRHANPCPPDDDVAGVGPVDPQIGILRIDRFDGRPLAVIYNFACHLLFAEPRGKITANFPGIASDLIEQTLGHGAMALFVQGAAGDVIDVGFKDFTRPRNVEPYGVMLGQSTLRALREIPATADATLAVASEMIDLPYRTDIPARLAELEQEQAQLLEGLRSTSLNFKSFLPLYFRQTLDPDRPADYSYRYLQAGEIASDELTAMDMFNRGHIEKYLRNLRAMETLARIQDDVATLRKHQTLIEQAGSPTVPAEIQGIRIGDCVLLAAPLEVLTEVSLNIKRTSPYPHTFVAAFSNGYLHYGPPASHYDKGGYEVTECLLAPQWQTVFESKISELIRKL